MYDIFHPSKLNETRYLFFTGKGGVGKTSTASATAIALAESGKRVLIVSTDPASNLQDVFEVELDHTPTPIPTIPRLFAINLDPEEAALAYRERVIGPYRNRLPQAAITNMEEQLSGACTVEIAAFDEFTNILANRQLNEQYDHIIFDTAPTGHTLRLLQLPQAWNTFLEENKHGASCLGPLSGLNEKKELYTSTVEILSNVKSTTLLLVTRPEKTSFIEASRASRELANLGITNQTLLINGLLNSSSNDPISNAYSSLQQKAIRNMPENLRQLHTFMLPLVPFTLSGTENLRKLCSKRHSDTKTIPDNFTENKLPGLCDLINTFVNKKSGVIMTMGKGGVGKTTIATAIALGLANKGYKVHLTTTDPAAHVDLILEDNSKINYLSVSRINPTKEVDNYRKAVLKEVADVLDEDSLELIKEDLHSPCTEEIAIFHAFANVVDMAKEEFVVIDTAPTGHTLLLLDAAESYHKEILRSNKQMPDSVKNLLPRLRNSNETNIILVTLPEATPVLEASRLQSDLTRANIHPTCWVINQSMQAAKTTDPILKARAQAEGNWIETVNNELSDKTYLIPWQANPLDKVTKGHLSTED